MSIQTGKKIGFFAAITMLVGTVVGIGIFFKSHGILRANDWNGTGTFLAWLLGGLLSLAAAISFSEIGSLKTKNVHGLAAWAERLGGKRFGYFVRFNFSFFYIGILSAVLAVFGSEMLFNLIATFSETKTMADFPVYAHIILGFGFAVTFLTLNFFSIKGGGIVQQVTTVLKWIPLLVVAFAGIILATTNNHPMPGDWAHEKPMFGHNAFNNGSSFKFTAMLGALPAVLFAFDAFINVASMRDKLQKPEKLPMVVIVGMVSVVVLYIFIALAAILHGSGMVSQAPFIKPGTIPVADNPGLGIFDQVFSPSVADAMGKFVVVFLLISTLGVINGISAAAVSIHQQAVETNTLFGAKTLSAKFGVKRTSLGFTLGIALFWTIVFGIPASLLNSDSIVDGFSNFPTLFFFGIYGTVILLYTLKRDSTESTKINNILFKVSAWTAIVGIFFLVGYQLFFGFTIDAILNPQDTTHWGLYVGDGKNLSGSTFPTKVDGENGIGALMTKAQGALLFTSLLAVFASAPLINKFFTKKFESNDVIINTQA